MSMHRVKKGLRKAGDKLKALGNKALDADQAYAKKIGSTISKAKDAPFRHITTAVPPRDLDPRKGTADSQVEKVMLAGMDAAVGTANIATRYALPAGGVTLAGKGLYDLTTQFGSKADEPEDSTLPLQ